MLGFAIRILFPSSTPNSSFLPVDLSGKNTHLHSPKSLTEDFLHWRISTLDFLPLFNSFSYLTTTSPPPPSFLDFSVSFIEFPYQTCLQISTVSRTLSVSFFFFFVLVLPVCFYMLPSFILPLPISPRL